MCFFNFHTFNFTVPLNADLILPLFIYLPRHLSSFPLAHPSTSFDHTLLQPRPIVSRHCEAVKISAGSAPALIYHHDNHKIRYVTITIQVDRTVHCLERVLTSHKRTPQESRTETPVYTASDEGLAAQMFVLTEFASTLYLVIRRNIRPVSRSNI